MKDTWEENILGHYSLRLLFGIVMDFGSNKIYFYCVYPGLLREYILMLFRLFGLVLLKFMYLFFTL